MKLEIDLSRTINDCHTPEDIKEVNAIHHKNLACIDACIDYKGGTGDCLDAWKTSETEDLKKALNMLN